MHVRPAHERPGEAAETDRSTRGGRQGQKKQVKDLLLCWREGYKPRPRKKRRHRNAGHSPTLEHTGRPKDDETQPEERPGKNAPMSPTLGIPSLEIRLREPDPDRVTPS